MPCWLRGISTALLLLSLTVACGGVVPPSEDGLAPRASGTPGTPTSVATREARTTTAVGANATPTPSTGPIRTPGEAAARALTVEQANPWAKENVAVKHVEWMTLGEAWTTEGTAPAPGSDDPSTVVWWVELSGTFHIPRCPAPPPGTPSTGCGATPAAVVVLAVSNGYAESYFLGSGNARPTPTPTRQIPSTARLKTPRDAIDAGMRRVAGQNGKPPALTSLRLLTFDGWLSQVEASGAHLFFNIDPSTPIWEIEFNGAALAQPCIALIGCTHDHVFVAFNAITGDDIGWWSRFVVTPGTPATPTTGTPSPYPPIVIHDAPLPDALISDNSSGDHIPLVKVDDPPLMTVEEAMAVVAQQVPWGMGGSFEAKPVTVQAWYGIVAIGNPGPNGTWSGGTNILLPSGEILPNLRDRLMWLIDYGNVPGMVSSVCPGCPPPRVYDHDVYAVDAQARAVLWWASYSST